MTVLGLFILAGLLTWSAIWLEQHGHGRDEGYRIARLNRDLAPRIWRLRAMDRIRWPL